VIVGLFQTVITIWAVITFYVIDFILINKYDHQRKAKGSGRSWDYTLLMIAAAVCVALQPVLLPGLSLHIKHSSGLVLQAVGICCLILSFYLHVWARRHLQQFYAERVEIQSEHAIVDTGPYAHIRHPVFTSLFGMVIGLVFVNPSLTTILLALYTFWDFTRAAHQEEALLAQYLPGYQAYLSRTNAFFPRIKRV